jgi:KipI family sensor histidine kinase inhibitor
VPAYVSLTLYYDPLALPLADLRNLVQERYTALPAEADAPGRLHTIPVAYGGEYGPDLGSVAAETGLTPEQVIAEHARPTYRVYMVGFSPGFPYLGLTSERLQVKRLSTPRTRVPAGSVAIAGRQTGLYPSATPGGWRLLGRTGWQFFDPTRRPPSRLQAGDQVRFIPSTLTEAGLAADQGAGGPEWGEPAVSELLSGRPIAQVLEGGLLTTVQDGGRYGYQSSGVPVAGVMDRSAMAAANLLVGNAADAPVLEITLLGPQLLFYDDVLVAVTGADLSLSVQWPDGTRLDMPNWMAIFLRRGSVLSFGGRRQGCRSYLAIAGGIRVPKVLGSASTYLAGGFGGHEGRGLQAGDWLYGQPLGPSGHLRAGRSWPEPLWPRYSAHPTLRVLPGPQWTQFTPEAQEAFLSAEWEVRSTSDRQGTRLRGPALERQVTSEVISGGVTMGSVQVPADGQPIVLGADRQTAGGYPQIAVVIGPDLPLLAQLAPGDRASFREVTYEEALDAVRAERARQEPV